MKPAYQILIIIAILLILFVPSIKVTISGCEQNSGPQVIKKVSLFMYLFNKESRGCY